MGGVALKMLNLALHSQKAAMISYFDCPTFDNFFIIVLLLSGLCCTQSRVPKSVVMASKNAGRPCTSPKLDLYCMRFVCTQII